jgi:prepilin-type N-terminal cleavage/methylation domain-containing protein
LTSPSWPALTAKGGFTLIEVVAALLIFSVGVLMVIQVSSALGTQMRYAGVRSQIAVLAAERLDSLESTPLDSIVAGTAADTLRIQGLDYARTSTVALLTPVLARVDVAVTPVGGTGPSHAVTSYVSASW